LARYARANEFARGSMGPKVQAVLDFVADGRGTAIITDIPSLSEALEGRAGTRVTSASTASRGRPRP